MSPAVIATLRQINANLRAALTRLKPEQTHCLMIKPQDFSDLLADLLSGADCVRNAAMLSPLAAEAKREMAEYRENLEALKQCLPGLHTRLLAERARLATTQVRMSAAAAWAQANKKTL